MEKKPLENLISSTGLWMSRTGMLHKIKHHEVSKRKIYIEMACGDHLVANNSKSSRTARALRRNKYRKTCRYCRISDVDLNNFLTKTIEKSSTATVKIVSTPKIKKALPKTVARAPKPLEEKEIRPAASTQAKPPAVELTKGQKNQNTIKNSKIEEIKEQGKTVVFLLEEEKVIGALALADIVRKESREAILKLKGMGIKCLMLTGDNRYVAAWVARELELDDYFAEVLPHEKAAKVKEVQKQYITGMVGDGVNDAPALAQADVGIAIGAGTDVAIETADIVLVKNDPRDVLNVIVLSRKTYSKMYQNLLWATGYNVFAIPLAAGILYGYGILLSPAAGAVLMSLSTIIVAINAKTLKMG